MLSIIQIFVRASSTSKFCALSGGVPRARRLELDDHLTILVSAWICGKKPKVSPRNLNG